MDIVIIGETETRVGTVTIGADVGQKQDPTAICVAETEEREDEVHHIVRYLERLPLMTKYPAVAARLADVARRVVDQTGARPRLYVDATGVGQPLVDTLEDVRSPADVIAVYFTYGDRRTEEHGTVRLGKAWMVSRLQVLLQARRLHLPNTEEARVLARELLDYEIRIDENANDRYGAFKVGTHDDLVTALGLATQTDTDEPGLATFYRRQVERWRREDAAHRREGG